MGKETNLIISDEGAYDKENPKSLYNLLPPSHQEHLLRVKNSFLNDRSEYMKKKEIKHTLEYPLVRKLRQSFWAEYDDALKNKRKMMMTHVWQGLTVDAQEYFNLMKKDHFAAYMFTKPIQRETQERALLELAYEQIEQILMADHNTKDGVINHYAAKLKVDVWKHLDERVNGGVIKQIAMRSEVKNTNTNTNVNIEATATNVNDFKRAEELNKKLAQLREQTKDIEVISYVLEEDNES